MAAILSSVHGSRWSCVDIPISVQASDMVMHERGCGHVSVELRVLASANA